MQYVVDMILDRTGNKGTGKMTIKEGADRGVAVSTMTAALDTRFISFDKDARENMEKLLPGPSEASVHCTLLDVCRDPAQFHRTLSLIHVELHFAQLSALGCFKKDSTFHTVKGFVCETRHFSQPVPHSQARR